jgi:phenylpropionate dioxygenase-like ring-hydroxylating dioxygenase large terminal subunit
MNARLHPGHFAAADLRTEDDFSLPGWAYWDPECFELERRVIFGKSWHLVGHANDVPEVGDFLTFRFLNESILTVRGPDGRVRSFHNVCRHRAARLVEGEQGNCGKRITCPYHAWSYATDGRLVGVPMRAGYPGMNTDDYGLAEVEQEIWRGFVFVRFAPGLPSVAEQMASCDEEIASLPLEDLVPLGPPRTQTRHVNWKNVADNYSDGLHIPVAHPGLTRVFGKSYAIEAREWVDKMSGQLVDRPSQVPSERMYHKLLHDLGLGRDAQWAYYKLWPNAALEVYPDQVDFMQFVPVTPTETTLRYINYGLPDERREMKALRYLNWRINRLVNLEDKDLIERVQAGMASSSFTVGPLGEGEVCLRSFGRRMRALFPEMRQATPPPKGWSQHRKAPRPQ